MYILTILKHPDEIRATFSECSHVNELLLGIEDPSVVFDSYDSMTKLHVTVYQSGNTDKQLVAYHILRGGGAVVEYEFTKLGGNVPIDWLGVAASTGWNR